MKNSWLKQGMKNLLGIFLICTFLTGYSQTLPKVYNQYFMNQYLYNPAYAGVEGHTVLFFMYKKQWTGIDGAPTQLHANFHVPLKGGLALGGMVYNESAGPYSQSAGKVSAGYLISVDREHFFRFGMSLGAGNNVLNFGELGSPNDPAFFNLLDNETFLIGDVGATYHFGHFNVGVSLPSLFSYDFITSESSTPIRVNPQDNVLLQMNYRGHISDHVAIEPHLLYRHNKHLKNQLEATVIFHLLHIVWVGGTYRQDAGFVGLLGAKFLERIGIGYSYEYGSPSTATLMGPTHEIHIGYHLGVKKAHAEHSSSFIKSHRQSAAQRAKEAELERQRKLQALKQSRQTTQPKADEDALGLLGTTKPEETKSLHWSYEKENKPLERVNKFGETERGIKFDRINEKGEKEVVFSWLPPPPPGAVEEVYEIADPKHEPLIRTLPDGTKEAGIKWIRTIDGGEKETLIIWSEIMTEEEASEIDHNEAVQMELEDARISIRREPEPVVEEPQEPVVEEEAEEPTIEEKPVIEEKPQVVEVPAEEFPVVVAEEPVKTDSSLTEDFRTAEELADSNKPQEVRRGGHMLELPAGNYVVAGAFRNFDNAEKFSDRLFERGYHDTRVGYVTATGLYYVVIYQSDSLPQTAAERKRVQRRAGLEKVWVLKVND